MALCELCNKEHDGSYGSGRFCSATCARNYSKKFISQDAKQRQIDALRKYRPAIPPKDSGVLTKAHQATRDKAIERARERDKIKNSIMPSSVIHNTRCISNIGELSTLTEFAKVGIPVYIPFGEAESADIIADFGGKLQKIQVKTSSHICNDNHGVIFNIRKPKKSRIRKISRDEKLYSANEVDYFALHNLVNGKTSLIHFSDVEGHESIVVRDATYNGRIKGKTSFLEDDISIDKMIAEIDDLIELDDGDYFIIDEG